MFYFKLMISIIILITCFYSMSNGASDKKDINCSILRKCSTNEDMVWATDKHQCYLFRNPCIFENEMCQRKENNKTELKVVSQEECKKYCQEICTEEYAPLCGEYDNSLETFLNECNFLRRSCQMNESFIFLHLGVCS